MAGISSNNQTNIAFKNLLGKSVTYTSAALSQEPFGIFFNVSSSNVWASAITIEDPYATIGNGAAVYVEADLVYISSSNGSAFKAVWPATPPAGTDPKTSSPFSYGSGSLTGIAAGNVVNNVISDAYGSSYAATVFSSGNEIYSGDTRNWLFQ